MRLQYEIRSGFDTQKKPLNTLATLTLNVDTGNGVEEKSVDVNYFDPQWSGDLVRVEGLIVHDNDYRFCVAIYRPGEDTQEAIGYVTIYTPELFPE
jgi:hypothetical protein